MGADVGAIEDGAVHADQAFIADATGVDDGAVADGGPVADFAGVIVGEMDDGAVLNIGVMADLDEVDIAAEHGVVPHAGVGAERDIAHDNGGASEVRALTEGGLAAEKFDERRQARVEFPRAAGAKKKGTAGARTNYRTLTIVMLLSAKFI